MDEQTKKTDTVHKILAHSYSLYLGALLLGLLLDFFFPQKFFGDALMVKVGVVCLGFATALIVWAQATSRNLGIDNLSKDTFARGPYKVSRTPTHWGLFLLVLGFGIISNAFFIVVLSVVCFVVTKLVFIKKQEEILEQKYGEAYSAYKKSVRF